MTPLQATKIIAVGAQNSLTQISLAKIAALLDIENEALKDAVKEATRKKWIKTYGKTNNIAYIIGADRTLATRNFAPVKALNDIHTWATALERAGYAVTRPTDQVRPCLRCGNEFISEHIGHRMCGGCRLKSTAANDYVVAR